MRTPITAGYVNFLRYRCNNKKVPSSSSKAMKSLAMTPAKNILLMPTSITFQSNCSNAYNLLMPENKKTAANESSSTKPIMRLK